MEHTVECPFCYGSVTIESELHATHSLPTCKAFDEADGAEDFIAKVRTGDAHGSAMFDDEEDVG